MGIARHRDMSYTHTHTHTHTHNTDMFIKGRIILVESRAYRLQRGRGHVTRHLAKFKLRLKSTVCIVQSRLQLLL